MPGLKSLLDQKGQSLAEGVVHADRGRVMVEPVAPPVALDHLHVEIPALTFVLRLAMTSAALALKETGARPGGQLRHFWVPE